MAAEYNSEVFDSELESNVSDCVWSDPFAKVRQWIRERIFTGGDGGEDIELRIICEKIDARNFDLGRTGD